MRIAFLCSGLEPGADGVGDYTRSLAAACTALGHETRIAALRDPKAPARAFSSSGGEARWNDIFRRPGEERAFAAWLRDFQPDWVSVQYTPFGFHPRGLGGARAQRLRSLLPETAKRHIMYHEIWLQPGLHGRLRHRVLGKLQRPAVLAWGNKTGFAPSLVHTQARLHKLRLSRGGVEADLLPIFSNLPITLCEPKRARAMLLETLRSRESNVHPPDDVDCLWIGHFGTMQTGLDWDLTVFAREITQIAKRTGRRACFVALGRMLHNETAWAAAAAAVPEAFFAATGPLDAKPLVQVMQACNVAFSSTPADIVEKSSANAAWRALKIPLLLPRAGAISASSLEAWPDPGLLPWPLPGGLMPSGRIAPKLDLSAQAVAETLVTAFKNGR